MNQKAFIAIVLAGITAGFGGLFIKSINLSASSIAWIRMSVPIVVFGLWIVKEKISIFRGNYKKMLGASFLNMMRMYLFMVAYIYTSIGNAAILFYSWPIFAMIFGVIAIKESVSKKQIALLMLAFSGLVISYSNKEISFEDQDFIGMLAAVGSAILYAMTVIIFKSESENYQRNEILFYQNLLGVFIFLPFFIFEFPEATWTDISIGILYGVVVGMISFSLFFYGLKYLKASTTSSLMYIEVVSAIVLSYLWMGEPLSGAMIVGGGLILLSSFLISRS